MSHDYLGDRLATLKLVENIRRWWQRHGIVVKVWIEKVPNPQDGRSIYVVRTALQQDLAQARLGNIVG